MSQFEIPNCCSRCLAPEANRTWQVGAEEVRSEGNTMTSTLHQVELPLCQNCYRQLQRLCLLYWVVGILVSAVLGSALAWFGPELLTHVKDIPIGVVIFGLGVFVAMSAWFTAWILRDAFVQGPLAKYDPTVPRLAFGNKRYQELFDKANNLFYSQHSSLGM